MRGSGFWQKLGFWPSDLIKTWRSKREWIWFHAVSVGELNAVWPLVLEIKKERPSSPIMLSCTTKAGYNLAKELVEDKDFTVFYFPFDLPWIINSLLHYASIKLFIIVETEIWPNTLSACYKKKIPILLVNARLSDKSFKNYLLLKFFFNRVVNLFTEVLAQSENDASKFKRLGINTKKIKVLGNIKFSIGNQIITNGQKLINNNLVNIIFASTHKGEEEIAINVYKNLLKDFKDIRLIIAPRHIERTRDIIKLVHKHNFIPVLKTENKLINSSNEVLILDTIGELKNFYNSKDITIMGGTFVKIGGHNILESIRRGSYTIIGPYDYKIKELTETFKEQKVIIQVSDTLELESTIRNALINKELIEQATKKGLRIIENNASVLHKTSRHILAHL